MFQKFLALFIILIGLIITTIPFVAGEKAYFIGDSYYINMKDSIDLGYEPFLKSLVQKERSKLAFNDKKQLRETLKLIGDSLEKELFLAKDKNKVTKIEQINIAKNELQLEIDEKEALIDEKYNAENLDQEAYQKLFQNLKDKTSLQQYITAIANEMVNPARDPNIQKINDDEIQVKDVNLQSKKAFLISGIFILLTGIFLLLVQQNIILLHINKHKYISIGVLIIACIYIGSQNYFTFSDRIKFDNALAKREKEVKEKMNDIRTLQITYFESKSKYCNSWDKLKEFAKNDSIQIIKHLVNKDDTAAVNLAVKSGLPLEETSWESVAKYAFPNKTVNISDIDIIPYSKEQFDLNAGIIKRNERDVHVFEIKTTKYNFVKNISYIPDNFDKNSALTIGSMIEPTTEGNW